MTPSTTIEPITVMTMSTIPVSSALWPPGEKMKPVAALASGRSWLSRLLMAHLCAFQRRLLEGQHVGDERLGLFGGHQLPLVGSVFTGNGHDHVVRAGLLDDLEEPRVARHYRVGNYCPGIVEVDVLPHVAGLAGADIGQVRSRALCAQNAGGVGAKRPEGTVVRVIGRDRGPTVGAVHPERTNLLAVAAHATFAHVDLQALFLQFGER